MTTAIAQTFKPTRNRVLILVVALAMSFSCYGLLSAQQARSATLAKQVWGGIRLNGVIQHQKHITAVSHASSGLYLVTFDRHVDNCAIELTSRHEGGGIAGFPQFRVDPGASTSQVRVQEVTADGTSLIDGDFDIFGMCPSS